MINRLKQVSIAWWFLMVVILGYIVLYFIKPETFSSSMNFFVNILGKVIPIFILVFVLMSLTNYFITKKTIARYLRQRGIKRWLFVIIGGILSTGPIYMWYPFLADLKAKGLKYGYIACFLYNRAVKIPLLPLMILYFSIQYVVVLTLVMIFMSIIQGITINKLMDVK
jgi:uncharacterized membrane protein YraQ (UPF0718 family)